MYQIDKNFACKFTADEHEYSSILMILPCGRRYNVHGRSLLILFDRIIKSGLKLSYFQVLFLASIQLLFLTNLKTKTKQNKHKKI